MRGLIVFIGGFLGGAALVGCLGGAIAYVMIKTAENHARRGWNLVPVVVYAADVPGGEKIDFSKISQRSVPEQFITSSVVKPDSASYVVNQRVRVPVLAGDVVQWAHFDMPDGKLSKEAGAACSARFAPPKVRSPAEIRAALEAP